LSSAFENADKDLHATINKAQVILLEVEAVKGLVKDSDPKATQWLDKIQTLIMEQGELIYAARRNLHELANVAATPGAPQRILSDKTDPATSS
jgi:hypothetical protein